MSLIFAALNCTSLFIVSLLICFKRFNLINTVLSLNKKIIVTISSVSRVTVNNALLVFF